jgi:hypothetical protein
MFDGPRAESEREQLPPGYDSVLRLDKRPDVAALPFPRRSFS